MLGELEKRKLFLEVLGFCQEDSRTMVLNQAPGFIKLFKNKRYSSVAIIFKEKNILYRALHFFYCKILRYQKGCVFPNHFHIDCFISEGGLLWESWCQNNYSFSKSKLFNKLLVQLGLIYILQPYQVCWRKAP